MLSDNDILDAMYRGVLEIEPFIAAQLQPASYDVRLDRKFMDFILKPGETPVDPEDDNSANMVEWQSNDILLHPGHFVLGSTIEKIKLSTSIAARIEGKSSLGRLGLMVHSTAGFIDPGFEGTITLEISNIGPQPVVLRAGMRIGQLCFFRLDSPASAPYGDPKFGSKYQGQEGPVASRYERPSLG